MGSSIGCYQTGDKESMAWAVGLCREAGLHIMGSKTFQDMASYWPTATSPFAAPMNEIPKAFFTKKGFKGIDPANTTTAVENTRRYDAASGILPNTEQSPAAVSWTEARVFGDDLADGIRKLKSEAGCDPGTWRRGIYARSLIATGLIDEYHLGIHPVALGSGLLIFTGLAKITLPEVDGCKGFPERRRSTHLSHIARPGAIRPARV